MFYVHIPVLLNEVIALLDPQPNQNFIDATLGGGGYTKAILKKTRPKGKILVIDWDRDVISNFKTFATSFSESERVVAVHGNFRDIDKIVHVNHFTNISGIVADLGLSSFHLDKAGRGFTFQKKEVLDMRFDKNSNAPDAKFVVNNYEPERLAGIFKEYGEEKFAKKIASEIQKTRTQNQIKYTTDLYQIIKNALPKPFKFRAEDSVRRIFQALRMEVNYELANLEIFLPKAFSLLNPGGRLAVVSFHSLEDRTVKRYFVSLAKSCVCPPEFPQCICGKRPQAKVLTKKPVVPLEHEIKRNPRSKSAKLRVIEKLPL